MLKTVFSRHDYRVCTIYFNVHWNPCYQNTWSPLSSDYSDVTRSKLPVTRRFVQQLTQANYKYASKLNFIHRLVNSHQKGPCTILRGWAMNKMTAISQNIFCNTFRRKKCKNQAHVLNLNDTVVYINQPHNWTFLYDVYYFIKTLFPKLLMYIIYNTIWTTTIINYFDGLVQERRNSIANALESRLSGTNPSISYLLYIHWWLIEWNDL